MSNCESIQKIGKKMFSNVLTWLHAVLPWPRSLTFWLSPTASMLSIWWNSHKPFISNNVIMFTNFSYMILHTCMHRQLPETVIAVNQLLIALSITHLFSLTSVNTARNYSVAMVNWTHGVLLPLSVIATTAYCFTTFCIMMSLQVPSCLHLTFDLEFSRH